jgi:hypothetical protein
MASKEKREKRKRKRENQAAAEEAAAKVDALMKRVVQKGEEKRKDLVRTTRFGEVATVGRRPRDPITVTKRDGRTSGELEDLYAEVAVTGKRWEKPKTVHGEKPHPETPRIQYSKPTFDHKREFWGSVWDGLLHWPRKGLETIRPIWTRIRIEFGLTFGSNRTIR